MLRRMCKHNACRTGHAAPGSARTAGLARAPSRSHAENAPRPTRKDTLRARPAGVARREPRCGKTFRGSPSAPTPFGADAATPRVPPRALNELS